LTGQIARAASAGVTLLHVMPQPPALYAHLPRMEETETRLLESKSELGINLRREKEMLERLGVPAEVRLRRGPVLEQILQELSTGDYDLVVTGSALSRSLRTYILGDISLKIVNYARCPVLVARSGDEPAEGAGLLRWLGRDRRGS
jgi:nucleotide-binding universal stress UspA family protein